jgi:hypothetical protein
VCAGIERRPDDAADYILHCHNGDAKEAINALIEEIDHLQGQLQIAASEISRGYTRGWMPQVYHHDD